MTGPPKDLADASLDAEKSRHVFNAEHLMPRDASIASTITVVDRNNSFDGLGSSSSPLGCRKCCTPPDTEGTDQQSGVRLAAAQLTGWAVEGMQALSNLASGARSGGRGSGNGRGRRSRQGWRLCMDGDEAETVQLEATSRSPEIGPAQRLEELMTELFCLQDLNGNGVLEEAELIKLNEKIAMLHYGKDTDRQVVKDKYRDLFRNELSVDGEAVSYDTFRTYMYHVLDKIDTDKPSQEMILEQFVAEATEGRAAFRLNSLSSVSDAPWLPTILVPPAGGYNRGVGARLEKLPPTAMRAMAEDGQEDSTPSYSGSTCKASSQATSSTATPSDDAQ